jgi:two-component system chemotaxis sensor kinase CheA
MSHPFDVGQLRHVFLEECDEGLDSIAQSLIALEADPTHRDARHSIFRVAHTVKGGASIVGFTRVAEYAHLFEDALEPLRSSTAPVSSRQITLLLRATDALRGMLAAESSGHEVTIGDDDRALLVQLAADHGRRTPAAALTPIAGVAVAPEFPALPVDRHRASPSSRWGASRRSSVPTRSRPWSWRCRCSATSPGGCCS